MSLRDELTDELNAYMRLHKIAPTRLARDALGEKHHRGVSRFLEGGDMTIRTVDKLRSYMRRNISMFKIGRPELRHLVAEYLRYAEEGSQENVDRPTYLFASLLQDALHYGQLVSMKRISSSK